MIIARWLSYTQHSQLIAHTKFEVNQFKIVILARG